MLKKLLFLNFLFIVTLVNSQEIALIRSQYPLAVASEEITFQLDEDLSSISSGSAPVLLAYQGAVKTLKAKFVKKVNEKKEYFKEGIELIETAVKSDPANIEIRYIRLSVQENSPKFLKYNEHLASDKEFILKNYPTISSQSIKAVIKEFVYESKSLGEAEKQSID